MVLWLRVELMGCRSDLESVNATTLKMRQPDQSWAPPESADVPNGPRIVILDVADAPGLESAMARMDMFLRPGIGVSDGSLLLLDLC